MRKNFFKKFLLRGNLLRKITTTEHRPFPAPDALDFGPDSAPVRGPKIGGCYSADPAPGEIYLRKIDRFYGASSWPVILFYRPVNLLSQLARSFLAAGRFQLSSLSSWPVRCNIRRARKIGVVLWGKASTYYVIVKKVLQKCNRIVT